MEFLNEIVTHYEDVLEFLEQEPILKEEFDKLRHSLKTPPDNSSRRDLEEQYINYQDILDFLLEIVALPKRRKFFV